MRVSVNYLAKRWHSMLAFVARVSFKFRRTENLNYRRVSTNADERISEFFSSSAMYLPLRLCIHARLCIKHKAFSHTYVHWMGCSVRRACGCLSTTKMVDLIGITSTNICRAVKKPEDWLKKKEKKLCKKQWSIKKISYITNWLALWSRRKSFAM